MYFKSKTIRTGLAGLAAAAALTLGACVSPSGVEEADGPAPGQAVEQTESMPTEGAGEDQEQTGDEIESPSDEPVDEDTSVANFNQKYTYPDGVEVEVIKIQRGKVTNKQAELAEPEASAGDPWVRLTVRVKNGSKQKLDAYSSFTVTYGPDGEDAVSPYLTGMKEDDKDISGKILPGRSKTAVDTFVMPTKHQNDPVLEFSFDMEHEAAIFAGSVKE